jgi:hypothetical protein
VVLSSFSGSDGGQAGFTVAEGEVDYASAAARFAGAASEKARLGFRVAVLLAWTAPLWMGRRLAMMGSLGREERSAVLDEMSRHRFFFVRELCLLLKLVACMAIFRSPAARARTGFDRPAPAPSDAKRSLAVTRSAASDGMPTPAEARSGGAGVGSPSRSGATKRSGREEAA